MNFARYLGCLLLCTFAAAAFPAHADDKENALEAFDEAGFLVEVHAFFNAARLPNGRAAKAGEDGVSGRALVTKVGVFSFLETPENLKHLKGKRAYVAVRITGQLYKEGKLVEIEKLELVKDEPKVDLNKYRNNKGKKRTIDGANLAGEELNAGGLANSTKLGTIHHLESDGKIYHYIHCGSGKSLQDGRGYHQKKVRVIARELPGNYLLVETVILR